MDDHQDLLAGRTALCRYGKWRRERRSTLSTPLHANGRKGLGERGGGVLADRMLLVRAMGLSLTLLGVAREKLRYDRSLKVNTSDAR